MKKIIILFVSIITLNVSILPNSVSIAKMDYISDEILDQTFARGLSKMSDTELDTVSGQAGFANVTYEHKNVAGTPMHVVQANLGIDIELYATIDKLKLGKYDYSGQTGANLILIGWNFGDNDGAYNPKWDVNFEKVQMGESPLNPMRLGGLIIRADFQEINGQKQLNRFIIGSDDVSGRIYVQRAKSFTGLMNTVLAYKGGIMDWFPDTWTRRSYILNGEEHGSWFLHPETLASPILGNVGKKGMQFSGKSEGHGFHIVMDKDHGIGIWAGFPISDIDSGEAFQ